MATDSIFIVVLGGGIDLQGNLPDHQFKRLQKTKEIYKKNPNSKIILSGKYSFLYEDEKPPLTEAQAMRNYLVDHEVDEPDLILEEESMDTIGNAYYVKKNLLNDTDFKKLIVVTSHFHLERVRFIFSKIFDKENIEFVAVKDIETGDKEEMILERQRELLEKTKKYLGEMSEDELKNLDKTFYNSWFYKEARPDWVKQFVAKGI